MRGKESYCLRSAVPAEPAVPRKSAVLVLWEDATWWARIRVHVINESTEGCDNTCSILLKQDTFSPHRRGEKNSSSEKSGFSSRRSRSLRGKRRWSGPVVVASLSIPLLVGISGMR